MCELRKNSLYIIKVKAFVLLADFSFSTTGLCNTVIVTEDVWFLFDLQFQFNILIQWAAATAPTDRSHSV